MKPDTEKLPPLSLAVIEDLKGKGLTQSQIAEIYGVTRQAISLWVRKYNGKLTLRQKMVDQFPWKVSSKQSQASVLKRVRDHGEYMLTGGKGMNDDKLTRLRGFYRKLRDENLVVEYDPNLPPVPGESAQGGFAYRPRRPEDGDLIIRVNEYTRMPDKGTKIWCFPPRDP